MPLVYATADDLTAFLGTAAPDNADRLLKGASNLVRVATRAALYDVTSAGLPSDPDVAEAFRDATCAQAAEWIDKGVEPGSGTAPAAPQSSSIGGATVNWGAPGGLTPEQTLHQLIPDALWYLESLGLLSGAVQVRGLTVAYDPLAQWWVHTTDVQRFAGAGAEGDTWDDVETGLPCFISDKRRLVRAANGEQVVAETTVLYPKGTPDIPLDSLITLPALFGGRTSTVLSVSRHDGGGLPTPDHLEVAIA